MPVRVNYTEDGCGVVIYSEALSTSEEINAVLIQIYRDERFPKLKYWIRDLSAAKNLTLTFEETKAFAQLETIESYRNQGILLAIVVGTGCTYAVSSMFKVFAHKSDPDINVFLSRDLADEWILSRLVHPSNEIRKH